MGAVLHYRHDGGAVSRHEVLGEDVEIPAPEGATEITEAQYSAVLAKLKKNRQKRVDGLIQADGARALEDFEALRAAGIPDATARRLSGYIEPDGA